MIEGLLWMVVANVAAIAAASAITSKLRTGKGEVDALLFLIIRLTLIDATIVAAGLGGFLTARGVGVMALLALAVVVAVGRKDALPRFSLPRFGWLAGIVTAVVAIRLLLQVWYFAPYTTDVLTYHLPKLAEWVRAGAFVRQLGVDSHAAFPGGHELLQMWWVVFLHNDVIIEMAGVEMLLLAGVATYALARWLNLSPRWSFFAAFLFVMTPGMQLEATSSLNDDAVTALVLTTFALALNRAPVGVLIMLAGIGAGVKGSYLYALPGPVFLWYWDWWDQRQSKPKIATSPVDAESPTPLFLAVIGLATGGYWYLRNWSWFGSPLYPMIGGKGGLIESTGHKAVSFGPDIEGFKANLFDLIDRDLLDSAHAYSGLSTGVSGWGAAAFACGIVAMIPALRGDTRFRRLAAGFLLSFIAMLFLIINAPWFTRFFFFVPALLALATAWLASRNRAVLLVAVPAMALEFTGTMMTEEIPFSQLELLMREPWDNRSLAPHYGAVFKGDAMGYYAEDHGEAYFLYRPDFSARVEYLRAMTPEDLVAEMHAKNVTQLYAVPGIMARVQVLSRAVSEGLLVKTTKRIYVLR